MAAFRWPISTSHGASVCQRSEWHAGWWNGCVLGIVCVECFLLSRLDQDAPQVEDVQAFVFFIYTQKVSILSSPRTAYSESPHIITRRMFGIVLIGGSAESVFAWPDHCRDFTSCSLCKMLVLFYRLNGKWTAFLRCFSSLGVLAPKSALEWLLIHPFTHGGCCHTWRYPPNWEQLGVKCLVQGYNDRL